MNDPIADLEAKLTTAAHRRLGRDHAAWRGRLSSRSLLITLAAIGVAGSATAAAIHFADQPSKPLAGPIWATQSGSDYAVSLFPDLRAGQAGWCGSLRLSTRGRITAAGLGCGPVRAAGDSMIVGGGLAGARLGATSISYVVVTANVPAVRFGHSTIATRRDPLLPNHWRYAIHIDLSAPLASRQPPPPATAQPGATPATPRPGAPSAPVVAAPVPLDANGQPLPMTLTPDNSTHAARSRPVTNANPARHCVIGTASGFIAGYRRVALGMPRIPASTEGRAFASCATTIFHTHVNRGGLTVAVLLDAKNPHARAAELPRTPGLSARRLGPGWLVVYGPDTSQRTRLLDRLTPHL